MHHYNFIFFLNTSNRIKILIIFYLEKIDEQKYLISKKKKKISLCQFWCHKSHWISGQTKCINAHYLQYM